MRHHNHELYVKTKNCSKEEFLAGGHKEIMAEVEESVD